MSKNILIGVGNLLFNDDGIGIFATRYLAENFSYFPPLEILDGGTLGFDLAEYFLNYENVFIVDTLSTKDEPGSIYAIPSEELLGSGGYKKTAHEVEVVSMLEAASLYEKRAKVTIIGIVPEDIESVTIGLSEEMRSAFETLVKTVNEEIEKLGIRVKRENGVSLDDVIKEYSRMT